MKNNANFTLESFHHENLLGLMVVKRYIFWGPSSGIWSTCASILSSISPCASTKTAISRKIWCRSSRLRSNSFTASWRSWISARVSIACKFDWIWVPDTRSSNIAWLSLLKQSKCDRCTDSESVFCTQVKLIAQVCPGSVLNHLKSVSNCCSWLWTQILFYNLESVSLGSLMPESNSHSNSDSNCFSQLEFHVICNENAHAEAYQ